jgi:hypothetical protein
MAVHVGSFGGDPEAAMKKAASSAGGFQGLIDLQCLRRSRPYFRQWLRIAVKPEVLAGGGIHAITNSTVDAACKASIDPAHTGTTPRALCTSLGGCHV